jgi:hypothetical protein
MRDETGGTAGSRWLRVRLPSLVLGPVVAVAVLVALLASAGSSSAAAATGVTPSDRALANAVNLKLSDLPGFRLGSTDSGSVGGDPGTQFSKCFGAGSKGSGDDAPSVSSPDFLKGTGLEEVSLDSTVEFSSTAALTSDATLAKSPRFPQCVADALAALTVSTQGVKVTGGNPHAERLPSEVKTTGSVNSMLSMRASMTWTVRGLSFPVYMDLYVVAVGHEEITMFVFATVEPVVVASEWRLMALMINRALAKPQ